MTQEGQLELRAIESLLGEAFVIPDYQRGYRWTSREVTALLDDVEEFRKEVLQAHRDRDRASAVGEFYCLQPVVVVRREQDGSRVWEVIDGQQRLTTIFLLLRYLRESVAWVPEPYDLRYATRDRSAWFLKAFGQEALRQSIDDAKSDNIDFHHMFDAYDAIGRWFEGKGPTVASKIAQCLLDPDEEGANVRVIWYQLPDTEDPVKAFIRLNVGKIPLTNSELIRALFLRSRNFAPELATRSQLAMAQEWDGIEKKLQEDAFWYFVHGGPSPYSTRIDYLFDIQLGLARGTDAYGAFLAYQQKLRQTQADSSIAHDEWNRIKELALRLEEWHEDRVLYHLVGYWIAVMTTGSNARAPAELMVELTHKRATCRRLEFEAYLKGRIFERLVPNTSYAKLDDTGIADTLAQHIGKLEYPDSARNQPLRSILLLFNVATLLRNAGSNLRFPFDLFHSERWDIEHIRSVASEMPMATPDQKRWLDTLIGYWRGEDADDVPTTDVSEEVATLCSEAKGLKDAETFDKGAFVHFYQRVLAHFGEGAEAEIDNSIGNLTLLDAHTNRSYKNAPFPVKRRRILGLDKTGTFVPLCTTNVFLKYYSRRIDQMMFWTDECGDAYSAAIIETLTDFFRKSDAGR